MAILVHITGLIIFWLSLYTKGDVVLERHGDDMIMCDSTPCNTSSSIRCHHIFFFDVCFYNLWHGILLEMMCNNNIVLERQGDDMVTSICASNLHVCDTSTTIRCNIVFFNNYCWWCGEGSNKCSSSPCQNKGTCVSSSDGYTCNCVPGYTGVQCEQDIDECSSNPCQNGATCQNMVNQFKCQCPPRIYGVLCDTNICHPTPADVVFVLDSSVSMTEAYFKKQLEFIANFTRSVPVGPRSFQISVVTFSFNAQIEFFLDQYKDNTSIIDAVKNITFKPGSTRTDRGLRAVLSVFSGEAVKRRVNGRQASRFVYLLTDGMSTYRQETKDAARKLKSVVDNIAVIGIGKEVSHAELLDIATSASLVYSVDNFNSLYTLLHQLVHNTCDECEHSAETDVAIFIDSSSDELETLRDAATYLIDVMRHLNINETHVGITLFSREIHEIVKMGQIFDKNIIKSGLNSFTKESDSMTIEHVLNYARNAVFNSSSSKQRPGTKKMLIIFTNGQVKDLDKTALNREKLLLEAMGVQIFAVAITTEDPGRTNVNLQGIHDLVQDTFNVFITMKGSFRNLDVLQAEFEYDRCDLKGE